MEIQKINRGSRRSRSSDHVELSCCFAEEGYEMPKIISGERSDYPNCPIAVIEVISRFTCQKGEIKGSILL